MKGILYKVLMPAFLVMSAVGVCVFLYFSHRLTVDMSEQERGRMELWAEATQRLAADSLVDTEIDFLLGVVEGNVSIPVILTDSRNQIVMSRNIDLPDDSVGAVEVLHRRLERMKRTDKVIEIAIAPGVSQHLYFAESKLLSRLGVYPYALVGLMAIFAVVLYFAVSASRRAEQNRVWVGLSKETAHQLGTPISSLMAWIEVLKDSGCDETVTEEMDKDVRRLSVVASRFSKIGSRPDMTIDNLCEVVGGTARYMASRLGMGVAVNVRVPSEELPVGMSRPLIEWVVENLMKNGADAMCGRGKMAVEVMHDGGKAVVEVSDTGCGIRRDKLRKVFAAGYTTKKRGWGLGLTLAKRIVERYHGGSIFVKTTEVGRGTTFRVELPLRIEP